MIKRLGMLAVGVCMAMVGLAGPAGAASGVQTFRMVYRSDPSTGAPGVAVATGPISAVGTDTNVGTQLNENGTRTNTDVLAFPAGSVTTVSIDPPDVFHFDFTTCVARIAAAGPYTITGGTGAYQGATGGGTFTVVGVITFAHTPQGCGQPVTTVVVVTATGTISIP
jgi:hypothetical protein